MARRENVGIHEFFSGAGPGGGALADWLLQPMTLDLHTLFLVTIYVEAILGQNLALRAVCWWGFAHLLRLASIALFGMYGQVPDLLSVDLANALLFTAFAVTWTGARLFDGRPVEPRLSGNGRRTLVVDLPPSDVGGRQQPAILDRFRYHHGTWLMAYEFWRSRDEPLVSRWPAIFILFAHGALFLLRTPMVALLPGSTGDSLFGSVWMTVLSSEALPRTKQFSDLRHLTRTRLQPVTRKLKLARAGKQKPGTRWLVNRAKDQ